MRRTAAFSLLIPLCLLTACADGREGGDDIASTGVMGDDGTGDDDAGDDTNGDADDEGDIYFDTPGGDDDGAGDGGEKEGCEKVDFLFVVDSSGSMEDDQVNLINNFPGFMEAIETTLEVEDFHVMVVDTDAGGNTHPDCYPWWEEQGDPYHFLPCPYPPVPAGSDPNLLDLWEECDGTMGAGIDMALGFDAPNIECNFSSGRRYIDETEPDLTSAFSCAAKVGTGGNNSEKPAEALLGAVSPEMQLPGACNEGFLRKDALLVVTLLTDEQDVSSDPKKDPAAWAQAVIDAKGGKEENVVMLGLLGGIDYPAPYLEMMVGSFTHSAVELVTIPDYKPFFEAVIGDIDVACDEFVPEG